MQLTALLRYGDSSIFRLPFSEWVCALSPPSANLAHPPPAASPRKLGDPGDRRQPPGIDEEADQAPFGLPLPSYPDPCFPPSSPSCPGNGVRAAPPKVPQQRFIEQGSIPASVDSFAELPESVFAPPSPSALPTPGPTAGPATESAGPVGRQPEGRRALPPGRGPRQRPSSPPASRRRAGRAAQGPLRFRVLDSELPASGPSASPFAALPNSA